MVINKLSAQLQLALRYENLMTAQTRSLFIKDRGLQIWEVIAQYQGDLEVIKSQLNIEVWELGQGFAQIFIRKSDIGPLSDYTNIIFLTIPKQMEYIDIGLVSICADQVANPIGNFQITGRGVLLAVIDSGINYAHPDFRNEDGTTRIRYLWDQTIQGNPPNGFSGGTEYTREQINQALEQSTKEDQLTIVPSQDLIGHGTALAGIAGGNGRGSTGQRNKGVAPECDLIIVKIGLTQEDMKPRDIEIMQGIKYVLERAESIDQPVSILLGSGDNLNNHKGEDVLPSYIESMHRSWPCNISVGTGNEGNRGSHTSGTVIQDQSQVIQFIVEGEKKDYACCIWKSITDEIEITIQSPIGDVTDVLNFLTPNRAYLFERTAVLINFSEPITNITEQQIFIMLQAQGSETINTGIWQITLRGARILEGRYNIWGSIVSGNNNRTRFLEPTLNTTLTSPSDSRGVTSVATYNAQTMQLAAFSGRGYTADYRIKPEITAPGVNITVPSINEVNLYTVMTGSSAAAAFMAGAYVVLLAYGMIQLGNINLYGDALKTYVIRNANRLPQEVPYPNNRWGYGTLCVEAALINMREVANTTQ